MRLLICPQGLTRTEPGKPRGSFSNFGYVCFIINWIFGAHPYLIRYRNDLIIKMNLTSLFHCCTSVHAEAPSSSTTYSCCCWWVITIPRAKGRRTTLNALITECNCSCAVIWWFLQAGWLATRHVISGCHKYHKITVQLSLSNTYVRFVNTIEGYCSGWIIIIIISARKNRAKTKLR